MGKVDDEIGVGCDYYVVQPVTDGYSLADIEDATVSAQLREKTDESTTPPTIGDAIGSPVSCNYQSGGEYKGTIPYTVTATLTANAEYSIWVTVSGTANDVREIKVRAVNRGKI